MTVYIKCQKCGYKGPSASFFNKDQNEIDPDSIPEHGDKSESLKPSNDLKKTYKEQKHEVLHPGGFGYSVHVVGPEIPEVYCPECDEGFRLRFLGRTPVNRFYQFGKAGILIALGCFAFYLTAKYVFTIERPRLSKGSWQSSLDAICVAISGLIFIAGCFSLLKGLERKKQRYSLKEIRKLKEDS